MRKFELITLFLTLYSQKNLSLSFSMNDFTLRFKTLGCPGARCTRHLYSPRVDNAGMNLVNSYSTLTCVGTIDSCTYSFANVLRLGLLPGRSA